MSPDLYPYIAVQIIKYVPIGYPTIIPSHKIGQTQRLSLIPPQISMSYVVQ